MSRKTSPFERATVHIMQSRARYMLSPVRLTVCPDVCLSHGWISQKTVEARIMQLSPQVAQSF